MSIFINSIEISLELYEKLLNDGFNFDNIENNEEIKQYNKVKKNNISQIINTDIEYKNNINTENEKKNIIKIDTKKDTNVISVENENKINNTNKIEEIKDNNIKEKIIEDEIKNIKINKKIIENLILENDVLEINKNIKKIENNIKEEINIKDEIKDISKELNYNDIIESDINEELKEESKDYENNDDLIDLNIDKEVEENIKEEINESIEKVKKDKKKNTRLKIDNVVPLNIFQTWHTKNMPYHMKLNVARIRYFNPEFKYYLFDDEDCREFIKKHFPLSILWAFDKLRPGAFKADLWRYCVLYIHGGIYMDIKLRGIGKFKLLHLTTREHFVLDYPNRVNSGIYNALISVKPKNKILGKCILQILFNVKNRYYGPNCLCPTGPQLVSKFLTLEDKMNIRLFLHSNDQNKPIIKYGVLPIIEMYPEYRNEQGSHEKLKHYSILWSERSIYN